MFGSSKKNGDDLPDAEWNFAEILEEDTEACFLYELAREIEHPELYFSVFASRELVPFPLEPMPATSRGDLEASIEFKRVRAIMYIRPFEILDDGQKPVSREMFPGLYFLHADGSFRGYPAVLQEGPWLRIGDSWQGNLQLYAEQFLTGITFHASGESQRWEKRYPGITEKLSRSSRWQLLAIKVDWTKNDSALIEGFTTWLGKQRPKGFPSTSWSGRQSTIDRLNALSALRLRHHYSIEDATKHTKTVLGKPLYTDRSSWDRAQRRAIQMFSREFPNADGPRSESKVSNRKG